MEMEVPQGRKYVSFILQGLVSGMLLMGSVNNLLQTEMAMKGSAEMGYPSSSVLYLGIFLTISTILYIFPKTTYLGAILLTGWLGGAVATHIIHGDEFSKVVFPPIFGIVMWLAPWLRDRRIAAILPIN